MQRKGNEFHGMRVCFAGTGIVNVSSLFAINLGCRNKALKGLKMGELFHIVTDGSCDLPVELTKEKDLTVVPFYVSFDDKTYQKEIVEIGTIRDLVNSGHVVIAAGGGGIPVFRTDGYHLKGAAAVVDKDFTSELLAEELDADLFIILTAVEKVAVNFGKPDQRWLDELTPDEAEKYMEEGQFAKGSMLPKVQAAVKFARSKPGRTALITLLDRARDGIEGRTGTRIHM